MGMSIKENGFKENFKEKENIHVKMDLTMKVSFQQVNNMDLASIYTRMELYMKVTGQMD